MFSVYFNIISLSFMTILGILQFYKGTTAD